MFCGPRRAGRRGRAWPKSSAFPVAGLSNSRASHNTTSGLNRSGTMLDAPPPGATPQGFSLRPHRRGAVRVPGFELGQHLNRISFPDDTLRARFSELVRNKVPARAEAFPSGRPVNHTAANAGLPPARRSIQGEPTARDSPHNARSRAFVKYPNNERPERQINFAFGAGAPDRIFDFKRRRCVSAFRNENRGHWVAKIAGTRGGWLSHRTRPELFITPATKGAKNARNERSRGPLGRTAFRAPSSPRWSATSRSEAPQQGFFFSLKEGGDPGALPRQSIRRRRRTHRIRKPMVDGPRRWIGRFCAAPAFNSPEKNPFMMNAERSVTGRVRAGRRVEDFP